MKTFAVLIILSVFSIPSAQTPLTFNIHPTGLFTGYDFQSNGTPQLIWQDPNHPENIHMVFTTSGETSGWADRNITYISSSDFGVTWSSHGPIQVSPSTRGGYGVIDGLPNGHPIAALHINDGTNITRTQIYINDSLHGSTWTKYDPGDIQLGNIIWPRIAAVNNNKIAFAGSINNDSLDSFFTNSLTVNNNTFSGWNNVQGKYQDIYSLAVSEDGNKVGLAYIGGNKNIDTFGDVYYKESTDGGATYNEPVLVYDYGEDSLGCYKGLDIIFLDNKPYIIFELIKHAFNQGNPDYYPDYPAKIMLWSPELNGGIPKLLADSNNVPYYQNKNDINDGFGQLCRPTIGRANGNIDYLFAAFSAPSPYIFTNYDSTSFFDAWFMYSSDKGNSWAAPQIINSRDTILDWRYISLSPTNSIYNGICTVHLCVSSDIYAGSFINSPWIGPPIIVECELIEVSTEIYIISSVKNSNNLLPKEFSLSQNYPNPFNPETKIKYQVPSTIHVILKIYDILGNEIITLVNEDKTPGIYEIEFNGKDLSSGIYYYKIQAGEYTSTKKLVLLR